jgi:hypothetical protein
LVEKKSGDHVFFAERNDLFALCLLAGWSLACLQASAQATAQAKAQAKPGQPVSVQPGHVPPEPGKVAPPPPPVKNGVRDVGLVQVSFPGDDEQFKYKLEQVVVQTWISTEPVVLSAQNFSWAGETPDKSSCPQSQPLAGPKGQMEDKFCVYGPTFDLQPYYSSTAKTAEDSSAAAASGTNPAQAKLECDNQLKACDAANTADNTPTKTPLTYQVAGKWKNAVLTPLRPFLQPNATSITFSDQVGINGLPRWMLDATANPAWVPLAGRQAASVNQGNGGVLNYISLNLKTDLNNQVNANPNSTVGSLQWNLRSSRPLEGGFRDHQWIRWPGADISITGAEYDFISNDVNLYFPSAAVRLPVAVLDKDGAPAVFVWKLQLGEISGWHLRDPSAGLAGQRSISTDIAEEGNQLFRGVAGTTMSLQGWGNWFSNSSINSSYQVMLPATDEPFTVASSSSSKPPTVTLTDKARHFVSTSILEKLGGSNFSLNITYKYGSLPPAFWLVKNSLTLGLTLTSGSGRTE